MAIAPTVLVADHDSGIQRLLRTELVDQGFLVEQTKGMEETIARATDTDIAVLDYTTSASDGLELMQRIRRVIDLPVILLTSENARDRIRALELGADDCLSSPFLPDELAARIRAVLRRHTAAIRTARQGIVYAPDDVEVDLVGRVAHARGEQVVFTKTEWALLYYLAQNPGRVLTNQELLQKVWPDQTPDMQYLRVWVARIRRKLERDQEHPEIIKTVQGVGYLFQPREEELAAAG